MRKIFSVCLLVLGFTVSAQAQWGSFSRSGDTEDVKNMQERNIQVLLMEEEPRLLKRYAKDPDKLKQYQQSVALVNGMVKDVMAKHWTFGGEIIYRPASAVKEASKDRKNKFVAVGFAMYDNDQEHYTTRESLLLTARLSEREQYSSFVIMPSSWPREGDLVMAVRLLQNHFQQSLQEVQQKDFLKKLEQQPGLDPTRTLLIDERHITKAAAANGSKSYPHPFEVVNYDRIEQIILNKDKGYYYLQPLPQYANYIETVVHLVIDPITGQPVAFSKPFHMLNHTSSSNLQMTEKVLEKLAKFAAKTP